MENRVTQAADEQRATEPDDIELVEMANLAEDDTGVAGFIYISSAQVSHGPRVKWYPQRLRTRQDPCLAVTIDAPQAINLNLPRRIADAAAGPVQQWVALNRAALLDYWNNGYSWTRRDVTAFIDALRKIP